MVTEDLAQRLLTLFNLIILLSEQQKKEKLVASLRTIMYAFEAPNLLDSLDLVKVWIFRIL